MRNYSIYIGALVLGVIALVIGILYLTGTLGDHPTRAYAGLGVGIVLIIIGIAGMVAVRNRGSA